MSRARASSLRHSLSRHARHICWTHTGSMPELRTSEEDRFHAHIHLSRCLHRGNSQRRSHHHWRGDLHRSVRRLGSQRTDHRSDSGAKLGRLRKQVRWPRCAQPAWLLGKASSLPTAASRPISFASSRPRIPAPLSLRLLRVSPSPSQPELPSNSPPRTPEPGASDYAVVVSHQRLQIR